MLKNGFIPDQVVWQSTRQNIVLICLLLVFGIASSSTDGNIPSCTVHLMSPPCPWTGTCDCRLPADAFALPPAQSKPALLSPHLAYWFWCTFNTINSTKITYCTYYLHLFTTYVPMTLPSRVLVSQACKLHHPPSAQSPSRLLKLLTAWRSWTENWNEIYDKITDGAEITLVIRVHLFFLHFPTSCVSKTALFSSELLVCWKCGFTLPWLRICRWHWDAVTR